MLPPRLQRDVVPAKPAVCPRKPAPSPARTGSQHAQMDLWLSTQCRCRYKSLSASIVTLLLVVLRTVSRRMDKTAATDIPAGSLRWDKLVRSSLASNMEGFMRGGRVVSLSRCNVANVVSTHFDYSTQRQSAFSSEMGIISTLKYYLAVCQAEQQADFVPFHTLLLDLRCDPPFCSIGLPGASPNIIVVCHGGRGSR